ncbi:18501_t:CDS:2 [Acaulospora morrowiae]|uniref:18501_t:CDS:1 n=1 Tax=Acaulospora morrowiae TaxID=94023 RepID=A0A9N9HLR4_9GLOM|nr:18501_t:CDS:2 [Acaulospora morrowiae]
MERVMEPFRSAFTSLNAEGTKLPTEENLLHHLDSKDEQFFKKLSAVFDKDKKTLESTSGHQIHTKKRKISLEIAKVHGNSNSMQIADEDFSNNDGIDSSQDFEIN